MVKKVQQEDPESASNSQSRDHSDSEGESQARSSSQVPHSDDSAASNFAAGDRAINKILKKTEEHSSHLLRAFWDLVIDNFYKDRREEKRLPIDLFPAEVGLKVRFGDEKVTSRNDGAVVLHSMLGNNWTAVEPVHPLFTLECKPDTSKALPQVAGELLATLQQRAKLLDRPLKPEESIAVAILIENISVRFISLAVTTNQLQSLQNGTKPNQKITLRVSNSYSLGDDRERELVLKWLVRVLAALTAPNSWVKALK
jgi:hypothetical protein